MTRPKWPQRVQCSGESPGLSSAASRRWRVAWRAARPGAVVWSTAATLATCVVVVSDIEGVFGSVWHRGGPDSRWRSLYCSIVISKCDSILLDFNFLYNGRVPRVPPPSLFSFRPPRRRTRLRASLPTAAHNEQCLNPYNGPRWPLTLRRHRRPPRARESHGRRPSISNAISWLHIHKSSHSVSGVSSLPYTPSKPIRISEPRFAGSSLDFLTNPPNVTSPTGPFTSPTLGKGAIVVRTPQEALTGSGVRLDTTEEELEVESEGEAQDVSQYVSVVEAEPELEPDTDPLPSSPESPALPPVPASPNTPDSYWGETPTTVVDHSATPVARLSSQHSRASQSSPSLPISNNTSRSTNKARGSSASAPTGTMSSTESEHEPPVPALPAFDILAPPSLPPFEATMMSPLPPHIHKVDRAKVIVQLETETSSLRTRLSTLMSRPSHLATYFEALLSLAQFQESTAEEEDSGEPPHSARSELPEGSTDSESSYSHRSALLDAESESEFTTSASIFHERLISAGMLPREPKSPVVTATKFRQPPSSEIIRIQVFLDRPSAPYVFI